MAKMVESKVKGHSSVEEALIRQRLSTLLELSLAIGEREGLLRNWRKFEHKKEQEKEEA